MIAVFKREFYSYFRTLHGYLFISLLLVVQGILVLFRNLLFRVPSFEDTFGILSIFLILFLPLLCMRVVTGDTRNGTDLLLASLPLSTWDIVCGKFLAAFSVFAIPVLVSGVYPLLLCFFGAVNLASAYLGMLAFLLLGAALIAVCVFLSAVSRNQIIAAVAGIVACTVLCLPYFLKNLLGSEQYSAIFSREPLWSFVFLSVLSAILAAVVFLTSSNLLLSLVTAACGILPSAFVYLLAPGAMKNLIPNVLTYLSPYTWFDTICTARIFDLRGIVFLLSMTAFFLLLTALSVGKRRRA